MTKKPLLIVLLLVAFLLSAWGNVIGAAFCPRYLAQNCFTYTTQQAKPVKHESCHHEMTDMDMGDMQMGEEVAAAPVSSDRENPTIEVAAKSSVEQAALDVPTQPCGHCWMHSQPPTGNGTLTAVNPPRSVGTDAPSAELSITLHSAHTIALLPLEHSPPGNSFPRHVLINVFRI